MHPGKSVGMGAGRENMTAHKAEEGGEWITKHSTRHEVTSKTIVNASAMPYWPRDNVQNDH
jgi:hypothetical protein